MAFRSGLDPRHVVAEVRRLVPAEHHDAAISLLNGVRDLGWDVVWIQLAALNLSGGRIDLLPQWIELANADPRDLKMATLRCLDRAWDSKYDQPPTAEAERRDGVDRYNESTHGERHPIAAAFLRLVMFVAVASAIVWLLPPRIRWFVVLPLAVAFMVWEGRRIGWGAAHGWVFLRFPWRRRG